MGQNVAPAAYPDSTLRVPGASRRRKALKIAAYTAGVCALALTVLLVGFRVLLARAPNYRAQVQEWVSDRTQLSIEFSKLDARLRFYGPELVFDSAVVRSHDRKRTLVRARRVSVGFDVWTAIGTGRLAAGRITLEAPELQIVRTLDGRIEVVGQHELPERDRSQEFEPDDLPTGRLSVIDARVNVRDLQTGRGPWIVPGVSFDFWRSGGAMHIDGFAALPAALGEQLRFSADTAGKLAATESLEWRFAIDARALDLQGWAQAMPQDFPARRGRGFLKLSGSLVGAKPNDVSLNLAFDQVAIALPTWKELAPPTPTLDVSEREEEYSRAPATVARTSAATPTPEESGTERAPEIAQYTRIALDLYLQRQRTLNSWELRIDNLELSRAEQPWRSKSITANGLQTPDGVVHVEGQADSIQLDNLWPLLAFAPESKRLAQIRALNARGVVRDVRAKVNGANAAPFIYTVSGAFEQLQVAAVAKAPGVERFGGVFNANEAGGELNLHVRDGAVHIPRYFRTPLPAERIDGRVVWTRESDGWRIAVSDMQIKSPDGEALAGGTVFVPQDGSSPVVDINATGKNLDARAAPRYMPAGKLTPTALAWLDRAFTAGTVPHAEFQMRGPTRDFPFRNEEGLFLIQAHIDGLSLDYQPGWMPASGLVIDAEFRNAGMTAKVLQGAVNGLRLVSGEGRFVDFKQAELRLDVNIEGDLAQGLPYLQQSPVGPAIGEQFQALRAQGTLRAQTQFRLPFKKFDDRKISVSARIENATVGLEGIKETATRVTGSLAVQDYALKSIALRGALLGGAFALNGGAEGRYYGRGAGLQLTASGNARATELANMLHVPKAVGLSGTLHWSLRALQARHAPDTPAPRRLTLESNGRGLGIGLPAPLSKSADSVRALRIELEAPNGDQLLARGSLGSARALIRIANHDNGWRIDRGGLRFDGEAASLPAHEGLRIEGNIDHLVLDNWLKIEGGENARPISDYLRAANASIRQFEFLGFIWNDVRALMQGGDRAWRVDVAGDDITGQLTIPYRLDGGEPLRIALNKLNLGVHRGGGNGAADPRDVPAISGRIDELALSGRRVGAARFELEKWEQGVQLKSGELRGESFTATGQGHWQATHSGSISTLTLDVASTDVQETLRAFNFHDVVAGKRANAHAVLTWPGAADVSLLARASGKVHVEMADGQLLNVEPGAGRMLGLMSIAALPRRLAFDFSDVTDKGFGFDTISGDFELKDGNAFTDNLLVRGPAGETGIVGRTGLGARDFDLTAVAAGDIGGSLSVASTAVAGPVVGAAVLAFTRLFKEPLKGVTRRYYRIDGSWDNPRVERIDKEEAKHDAAQAAPNVAE